MEPISVFDYEILAEERMDPLYWDYFAGGSDDEGALAAGPAPGKPDRVVNVRECVLTAPSGGGPSDIMLSTVTSPGHDIDPAQEEMSDL